MPKEIEVIVVVVDTVTGPGLTIVAVAWWNAVSFWVARARSTPRFKLFES